MSGARDRRHPALAELMADARRRRFGAVVVWSLDQFGRSLLQIVANMHELAALGIEFSSIKQALGLSTMQGRLTLYVFSMLAEIERDMIVQRVRAGLAAAPAKGTVLGRPRKTVDPSAVAALLADGCSKVEAARRLRVSRRTSCRETSSDRRQPVSTATVASAR